MKVYIFYRGGGMWYPLVLKNDAEAIVNAERNPGTVEVREETVETLRTIWRKPEPQN